MKRYLIIAVVLLITFLSPGCSSKTVAIEPAVGSSNAPTKNETLPPPTSETEMYSRRLGISIEEADRRLKLQEAAGKLQVELSSKESETFVGLWIEHTPTFKIIVQFTQNGGETIKPYLTPELAAVIEVRSAKYSYTELENAQRNVISSLRALGIKFDSAIYEKENRVVLKVTDRSQIDSAIQSGRLVLPDCVEIRVVAGRTLPA